MAITSPFSTKAQVRLLAKELTVTEISDVNLDSIIAEADKKVLTDLSNLISVPTILNLSTIPYTLNLLSVYLSRSYAYKFYGGNRVKDEGQKDLADYWNEEYTTLLTKMEKGTVNMIDSDGDNQRAYSSTVNRAASEKLFGTNNYNAYDSDVD